ncbi:MAG: hypothetical protein ABI193_21675 [Minicystis sp.]
MNFMSKEARALAVLRDARFWQFSRVHLGHDGPCPHQDDLGPCWQYSVGLSIEEGRVRWLWAAGAEDAIENAARVLLDGVAIQTIGGYAG